MSSRDPRSRDAEVIRARRRAAMQLGFSTLLLVCAAACIFDKSDYDKGGRSDKGATATASPTATDAGKKSSTSRTDASTSLTDAQPDDD